MQMERRNNGDYYYDNQLDRGLLMESTPPPKIYSDKSSPLTMHSASSSPGGGGSVVGNGGGGGGSIVGNGGGGLIVGNGGGVGYIEHTVTKFDTLAGVAIKYGVEVADIKRMNGLTTDLQMFARKSLRIPLPGRHPPSPVMTNGYDSQGPPSFEMTPPNRRHSDLFDSIKSLKLSSSSSSSQRNVSPAMSTLRGYYGLTPNNQNGFGEGFEMTVYGKGRAHRLEDGPLAKQPQMSTPPLPLGLHRKSKSLANGFPETGEVDGEVSVANNKESSSEKAFEKLVRRRKSEVDLENHTPEMILKQDNSGNSGLFSAAAGKGLALRPKSASRATTEAEPGSQSMFPVGPRDPSMAMAQTASGVRKSSSTPAFQDSDNSNSNTTSSSSIWPTSMLSLTADLQALSAAAITRPIFDGLPPISGRKNKAALD